MAGSDTNNSWEKIRRNVKDAEVLISQKKYNLSMVKSRQALESMIRTLCENASIGDMDLASSIDALYSSRWISKTTCEHYHKIRLLGNKAAHEGNDNAYDANNAYHLLSKEVYTFANEYKSKRGQPRARNSGSRDSGGRVSESRTGNSRRRNSGYRSRRRQPANGFAISPTDIVRIVLILALVVGIVFIVRFFFPGKSDTPQDETTTPTETTMPLPETLGTAEPPSIEVMPETTPAPVYKTTSSLNVRSEPSTAGQKLGLLEAGTIIDYVEDYDDEWTVINYNGTQAYVNSQYLTHD